jgi:hypothetical protein
VNLQPSFLLVLVLLVQGIDDEDEKPKQVLTE